MSLSIGNFASFTNSVDVPKKLVPVDKYHMNKLDLSPSPAAVQSGKDDSRALLVFTAINPGQPGNEDTIIINFGPGTTGTTNRDTAYATVLAAGTAV